TTFTLGNYCTSDSQCSMPTPRCSGYSCVQCVGASDCPASTTCQNNVCTIAAPTITSPVNASTTYTAPTSFSGTAPAGIAVAVVVDGSINLGPVYATS